MARGKLKAISVFIPIVLFTVVIIGGSISSRAVAQSCVQAQFSSVDKLLTVPYAVTGTRKRQFSMQEVETNVFEAISVADTQIQNPCYETIVSRTRNVLYLPNVVTDGTTCHNWTLTAIGSRSYQVWDKVPVQCGGERLPDTGQIQSYTQTAGEDSDYQRWAMDHLDNGDGTVTDTITGLTWQKNDNGVYFNWFEAAGVADDILNPGGAVDACGELTVGGYTDWRLPDRMELSSILHFDNQYPAVDSTVFADQGAEYYWSSTDTASIDYEDRAWVVYFFYGAVYSNYKYDRARVRCVRGNPIPKVKRLPYDEGAFYDSSANLMWQMAPGVQKDWTAAVAHCEDLSLSGYSDWRLPNIKELMSLANSAQVVGNGTEVATGGTSVFYWSSTTFTGNPGFGWGVVFDGGRVYYYNKTDSYGVRCVRGL